MTITERAQPWLGTIVSVGVEGLTGTVAGSAIDAAFAEIATVHRCMSFHDTASDVSLLNAGAHLQPVKVHSYTYKVLEQAQRLASESGGTFDITTGQQLVDWEFLPRHEWYRTSAGGCWRDIELLPDNEVRFKRSLCIDLGGIAKGFAVDCGIQRLRALGCPGGVINAGGDVRVYGEQPQRIALNHLSSATMEGGPTLELSVGSVASSSGRRSARRRAGVTTGVHVDGRRRMPADTRRFVSVVSLECVTADALTKVVIAKGKRAAALLRHFESVAYLYDWRHGWELLGNAPA